MTAPQAASAALAVLLCSSTPMLAASDSDCSALWQKSDINSDNLLTRDENLQAFATDAQRTNLGLNDPERMTREEFLSNCKADAFKVSVATPAKVPAPKAVERAAPPPDVLKTGANSFTEDQARKRIEGMGFSSVGLLAKDPNGVWRGSAMKDGRTVDVGLDFQGTVVAN